MNIDDFIDRNSHECSEYSESELPLFLKESIKKLKKGCNKYKSDKEYDHLDADIDELISSINAAEVEDFISHAYADFLRKKYLEREYL